MRNYFNPGAVIAVAYEAYKLYNAAQEARRQRLMMSLLKDISNKIDIIIKNQSQILDELKHMGIEFKNDLRNEVLITLDVELASYRSELAIEADKIGEISRRESLKNIARLFIPVRNLNFRLLGYGFAAFTASIGAALLMNSVLNFMRELGGNANSIDSEEKAFLKEWERRISIWFDVDSKEGIAFAILTVRKEADQIFLEMNDHSKKVFLGRFDTGQRNFRSSTQQDCEVHQDKWLVITGDPSAGYSDQYEGGKIDKYVKCKFRCYGRDCRPNWHGPAVGVLEGQESAFSEEPILDLIIGEYDPEKPFDFPEPDDILFIEGKAMPTYYDNASFLAYGKHGSFVPVNHPITLALNQKRSKWIEKVEILNDLLTLERIMNDLRSKMKIRAVEID